MYIYHLLHKCIMTLFNVILHDNHTTLADSWTVQLSRLSALALSKESLDKASSNPYWPQFSIRFSICEDGWGWRRAWEGGLDRGEGRVWGRCWEGGMDWGDRDGWRQRIALKYNGSIATTAALLSHHGNTFNKFVDIRPTHELHSSLQRHQKKTRTTRRRSNSSDCGRKWGHTP